MDIDLPQLEGEEPGPREMERADLNASKNKLAEAHQDYLVADELNVGAGVLDAVGFGDAAGTLRTEAGREQAAGTQALIAGMDDAFAAQEWGTAAHDLALQSAAHGASLAASAHGEAARDALAHRDRLSEEEQTRLEVQDATAPTTANVLDARADELGHEADEAAHQAQELERAARSMAEGGAE